MQVFIIAVAAEGVAYATSSTLAAGVGLVVPLQMLLNGSGYSTLSAIVMRKDQL